MTETVHAQIHIPSTEGMHRQAFFEALIPIVEGGLWQVDGNISCHTPPSFPFEMGGKLVEKNGLVIQYEPEDAGLLIAQLIKISGVCEDNLHVGPLVSEWLASLPSGAVIEAGVGPGSVYWVESVPQPNQPAMIVTATSGGLDIVNGEHEISHISAKSGRLSILPIRG